MDAQYKRKKRADACEPYVRPTKARIRQAMFNVLRHSFGVDFAGACVLDGFAGTGALGFDAASLGARHITFVEKDRYVAGLIRDSAKRRGVPCYVFCCDFADFHAPRGFDVVFLDPPYCQGLVIPAMLNLRDAGAITNSVVCIECANRELMGIHLQLIELGVVKADGDASFVYKTYGHIGVAFYRLHE
ncbi:MAG: RsmD family RNA methyltransferase [Holosporales bacterium]|jgi:16S rRNA (guanine966-N2)-methyltransferase|nr:RsmD family RNA methyltransferase [Holosporales bacterium]